MDLSPSPTISLYLSKSRFLIILPLLFLQQSHTHTLSLWFTFSLVLREQLHAPATGKGDWRSLKSNVPLSINILLSPLSSSASLDRQPFKFPPSFDSLTFFLPYILSTDVYMVIPQ